MMPSRTAMTYEAGAFPCGDPSVSATTGCARCGTPSQNGSVPHITAYHGCEMPDDGHPECRGIFPLCESCWAALAPFERWPYYAALLGYQAAEYIMAAQPPPPAYIAERIHQAVLCEPG